MSHNLEALRHGVLEQAQAEAHQLVTEAQARADDLRQQGTRAAHAEAQRILAEARATATTLQSETAAQTQMEAQMLKLQRREHALERAFTHAQQQLATVSAWPDYPEVIRHLIHEAAASLDYPPVLVLHTDARGAEALDAATRQALAAELGCELEMAADALPGTGVLLKTPDGHQQCDNTLETRLERMKTALRAPVYHILLGKAYAKP